MVQPHDVADPAQAVTFVAFAQDVVASALSLCSADSWDPGQCFGGCLGGTHALFACLAAGRLRREAMQKQPNALPQSSSARSQCVLPKRRSGEDATLVQALTSQVIVAFFASSVETDRSHGPQGMVGIPIPSGWDNVVRGTSGVILLSSPLSRMSRRVRRRSTGGSEATLCRGIPTTRHGLGSSDWRAGISPTECCAGCPVQHSFLCHQGCDMTDLVSALQQYLEGDPQALWKGRG